MKREERKRRLFAAAACAAALAVAAVSGTLAYLQDEDSDVNVMTLGNVKIEQIEQEYGTDGKLQDFTQDKPLYPYTGNMGWTKTDVEDGAYRQFTMKNAVDKYVSVKNTGESDAYVRTFIALEMGDYSYDEFKMVGISNNALNGSEFKFPGAWEWTDDFETTIDGKKYNVMVAVHKDAVKPGDTTIPSLLQVYLSKDATNEVVEKLDGNGNGKYDILAFSEAVQVEGFDSAQEALNTAFGDPKKGYCPWESVTIVDSADELIDALAAGGEVALAGDIKLEDSPIVIANGAEATLDLNGFKLQGIATNAGASSLIKVNENATLTIKDGTVSFGATTPDTNWGGDGQPPYPGYANNTISNLGTLIIDGATIVNVTEHGGASYAIDCYQGSNLIVNSGVIDGRGKCAIRMFCNSNTLSTNVTINGGTITGKRAIWVQLPGSNINNVRPVNLTINGGELICTNTVDDRCIYSYSYGDSFANTNITITGGTFTGNVEFGGGEAKTTRENVTITGGTFNGKVGRWITSSEFEEIAVPTV